MSRFKKYLEMVTTASVVAPGAGQVGTIRKIKRLKGGKFKYQHADPASDLITVKNPDGSIQKQKKIKGLNEVRDYSPEGIFVGGKREGSEQVRESIREGLIGIQKRPLPTMTRRGKK